MIYFLSLLHLTNQTDNLRDRLGQGFIYDPARRLPFKAFITWVQLELYLNRYDVAKDLINEYISNSTTLAEPKPTKPLLENGN